MVNEIVFDIGLQAGGATANAITFDIGLQATAATAPTGTSALTIPLPTISATGQITYQGTSALTIPLPSIAASGQITYQGTSALTIPIPTIAASGTVSVDITGTSAVTIPLPTISATGQITYQGTSALTIPLPTIAASGTATHQGTSAVTIPIPAISSTGQITYQGTSALTIPIPTIAAAGTAGTPGTVTGTSAVTIPLPLISAQGLIAGYSAPSFVEFQSSLFAYMDRRPLDLLPVIENSFWAKNVDENFRRIEEWLEPLTRNNPEGLELFAQMFGGVLVSGHVAASTAADATGDSTFEHGLRAVPRFVFWHARTDDVSASPDRILYFPAGGKGSLGANHQPWDAERVHVRASDSGTYTFIVM